MVWSAFSTSVGELIMAVVDEVAPGVLVLVSVPGVDRVVLLALALELEFFVSNNCHGTATSRPMCVPTPPILDPAVLVPGRSAMPPVAEAPGVVVAPVAGRCVSVTESCRGVAEAGLSVVAPVLGVVVAPGVVVAAPVVPAPVAVPAPAPLESETKASSIRPDCGSTAKSRI